MSDKSLLPFLSRFDPAETSEGSLDPLGLYALADALAVRLAPGVRERQSNPRFLTLALVGMAARAKAGLPDASPQGLPSWLVYEWVVVDALVSEALETGNRDLAVGIPGRDKVMTTLQAKDELSPANYLKTPNVFGFHGIYRVLGVKSGLFDVTGRPGEAGFAVLRAWEEDQGLAGFVGGEGPGARFRQALASVIATGLSKGTSRLRSQELKRWIREHLSHRVVGDRESMALWSALSGDALRREYLDLLTSDEGQGAWERVAGDEAAMHVWMRDRASGSLRALLFAAAALERVFRLLTDAFDEIRNHLGDVAGAVRIDELADGEAVQRAAHDGPAALAQATECLGAIDPELRNKAEAAFGWTSERHSPSEFVAAVVAHHERVQRSKPPNGKRSWFDTYGDGRIALRTAYVLREPFVLVPDRYVHPYRLGTLWSFAERLGRVRSAEQPAEVA